MEDRKQTMADIKLVLSSIVDLLQLATVLVNLWQSCAAIPLVLGCLVCILLGAVLPLTWVVGNR